MHRHTPHVLAATVSPIFSYIILHFFSSIFFFLCIRVWRMRMWWPSITIIIVIIDGGYGWEKQHHQTEAVARPPATRENETVYWLGLKCVNGTGSIHIFPFHTFTVHN